MIKSKVDKLIKKIVNKIAYNKNVNKEIKPYKDNFIKKYFSDESCDAYTIVGNIGEVKLTKVTVPYVDLVKLKANTKDYKKYVTYKSQYRLTAKEYDVVELKEFS